MLRGASLPTALLALAAALLLAPARTARAQITSLADDIILITKGVQVQENQRADSRLGGAIGSRADNLLGPSPGGTEVQLGAPGVPGSGGTAAAGLSSQGVLQAAESEGQHTPGPVFGRVVPQPQPKPASAPIYGSLELPETSYEGPAAGLTLDVAIERLVKMNHELRSKYYEIPQARADVLTASLRANPLLFGTAGGLPYGSYSTQRPGNATYSGTVIYPLDVGRKRLARTEVAQRAEKVIEAQYQDAVRMQIETLHGAFVDALAARETYRYAVASRDGLQQVLKLGDTQFRGKAISRPDYDRIAIQAESAEIGVEQAAAAIKQANYTLGLLLDYKPEESEHIELRAALRSPAIEPPSREQLVELARAHRADLNSFRLGVERAQADVRLAQAEKHSDLFLLYTPYQLQDNRPLGTENSNSWSLAVFGSMPLFNRNQGNIRRAETNVAQTRSELEAINHHVEVEVDQALAEYRASLDAVQRIERTILPRSKRIRDASLNLLRQGEASALDYLNAQREYNDVVRQYRDALIRQRRATLRLNTAVGMRLLP